jgi:hypothetical protein
MSLVHYRTIPMQRRTSPPIDAAGIPSQAITGLTKSRTPLIMVFALVMHCLAGETQNLNAEQASQPPPDKRIQRIVFVDEQQTPIEGVKFLPHALNTSYFWPEKIMGKPKAYFSNKQAAIEVEYPPVFADGKVVCETIDGVASDVMHISQIARVPVISGKESRVVMKPGIRLALQGIDENGQSLQSFTALASSDQAPKTWKPLPDGFIESHAMPLGHSQVMLVHPREDGKTCFSECWVLQLTEQDRATGRVMENIEVLPGVRLDGRLAEQVPRPVKNGMVMAYCAPLPIETAVDQDYVDFLIWSDWTEIREDGTFTFDSLPQKGKVQVIALCDGWIGKTDRRTVGEQITLEGEGLEIVLPMYPTIQAVVFAIDRQGKPVENARIDFGPNQVVWDRFSTRLGRCNRSIDSILSMFDPTHRPVLPVTVESRFRRFTNEQGMARIPNLPAQSQGCAIRKNESSHQVESDLEVRVTNEMTTPNFEVFLTVQID